MINRKISVAPMMDWTDKHCRYFMRLLSPHVLLYTEMVVTGAILHNHSKRFLDYNAFEQPLALQLGGSDPNELAQCAKIAAKFNYQEINLNVGCPSDRVQSGHFGACLMREPKLVAECIAAMQAQVDIPVTVKTRLGVDDDDSYDFLTHFVTTVASAGCKTFIIHARKAWLKGLNPKQNREIPPLNYERVLQLKHNFPDLEFVLNGGITTIDQIQEWLPKCDGIMLGRAAYQNPAILVECEKTFFDPNFRINYENVLEKYVEYMQVQHQNGVSLTLLTKPLLGLFHGYPGAKSWRRSLTEDVRQTTASANMVLQAFNFISL